jgi:hypothetical protein
LTGSLASAAIAVAGRGAFVFVAAVPAFGVAVVCGAPQDAMASATTPSASNARPDREPERGLEPLA